MSIHFTTNEWPIVITTIDESMDEVETEAYLTAFLSDVVGRNRPFVSIVDARAMRQAPSAKVRRIIADWEERNAATGARYNRGIAFVTESALIRGAMTALHWISPPKTPTTFEASMEAARRFASTRLAASADETASSL